MKSRVVCGTLLTLSVYFFPIFSEDRPESEEHNLILIYENYDEADSHCFDQACDTQKNYENCLLCQTEQPILDTVLNVAQEDQAVIEALETITEICDIQESMLDALTELNNVQKERIAIDDEDEEFVIELPSYLIDGQDIEIEELPEIVEVKLVPSYEILQENYNEIPTQTQTPQVVECGPIFAIEENLEICGNGLCLKPNQSVDEDIVVSDDEITLVPHELINSVKKAAKKKKKLEEKLRKEKLKLFKKSKKLA